VEGFGKPPPIRFFSRIDYKEQLLPLKSVPFVLGVLAPIYKELAKQV
jgi:hypothetical protein